MKALIRIVGLIIFFVGSASISAQDIVVKGLLKNMVVLEIDGVSRTIRAGKTTPEGITLISADTKQAIVEINGERKTLTLSRQIGGGSFKTPEKTVVRIPRGVGDHYFTPGRINNRQVHFLVDTGATTIALNSIVAERLGLDYKRGQRINVGTANGVVLGYRVTLNSVSIGTLEINNVEATVTEGPFPSEILLGNSYLSRVDYKVEQGVLVLQARF